MEEYRKEELIEAQPLDIREGDSSVDQDPQDCNSLIIIGLPNVIEVLTEAAVGSGRPRRRCGETQTTLAN